MTKKDEQVHYLRLHEITSAEPLRMQVRRRWDELFSPQQELFQTSEIQHLPTGIGGALGTNRDIPIRVYPDGSKIPPFFNLQEIFGSVPKVLTLTASPLMADDVVGLLGLAAAYKDQGVKRIILQLTAMAHERQDHGFNDSTGTPIQEVVTLAAIARMFASPYERTDSVGNRSLETVIDAGMTVQAHSDALSRMALKFGIPLLSFDAFDYLANAANIGYIEDAYVLGPDKGRHMFGRAMAGIYGFPYGSATKNRDRLGNGHPTVIIPPDCLATIQSMGQNGGKVLVFDDEIREGGTMGAIADALVGYASSMVIYATKAIFAGRAIENLNKPIIHEIHLTDAVEPVQDISALNDRLQWHSLHPELDRLSEYLQSHLSETDNPGWISPRETGTLLKLSDE